jgi:WD40 repeat protein
MYRLSPQYRGYPAWASGSLLVLGDTLQPVRFWDTTGRCGLGEVALRKPSDALPTLGWPVHCFHGGVWVQSTVHRLSADGRWAVGDGCAWDLRPCLEALSTGVSLQEPRPILLPGEQGKIWYPAALAGEHLLRIRDGVGEVWALDSQHLVGRVELGVTVSRVDPILATGRVYSSRGDRVLTVTDIATGQRLAALEHTQPVRAVCSSPDGRLLGTAAGVTVRLWDTTTFDLVHRFKGVGKGFIERDGLSFHPSGRFLAVCCPDQTVRYWTTDGGELARFKWGDYPMAEVSFSPDGMLAAGRSFGCSVIIWDVDV